MKTLLRLPAIILFAFIHCIVLLGQPINLSWQPTNSGNWKVNKMARDTANAIYACTDQGIYKTIDEGNTWLNITDPFMGNKINTIFVDQNSVLYVGTWTGLFISLDLGGSWAQKYNHATFSEVRKVCAKDSNEIFIRVWDTTQNNGGAVFLSANFGASWIEAGGGLIGYQTINELAIDTSGCVYSIGGSGLIGYSIFYKWNYTNAVWDEIFHFSPAHEINEFIINSNNTFIATASDGVMSSGDLGLSWVSKNLYPKNCLTIESVTNDYWLVGTIADGIYSSPDTGITWFVNNGGLPMNPIQQNLFDPILSLTQNSDGIVFAGTRDSGVYKSTQIINAIQEEYSNTTQRSFFPNPFTTHSTLLSDRPYRNGILAVCNPFGQIVKQIDNLAGEIIVFHRENLPGGLYYFRLTQDNKVITTGKLVITDS